jgi:hypothetical protein
MQAAPSTQLPAQWQLWPHALKPPHAPLASRKLLLWTGLAAATVTRTASNSTARCWMRAIGAADLVLALPPGGLILE